MELNRDICLQAMRTRDARFDGRFFTAVTSTGIFCRTVCPAVTPREDNCIFYPSAAAAMDAGYRPCLRCRPETAPNSPAWNGVSTTVSRALKLIHEGALDEGSVDQLAGRLGVGERHLRRLFLDHLGAPPKSVAQTRRLLFAKKLVTETRLPLTEIALASGFQSIRRFNDAFRKSYKRPPRELRREVKSNNQQTHQAEVKLQLSYRPPYDWPQMLDFFRARAISGLEFVDNTSYARAIYLWGQTGLFRITHASKGHKLDVAFHFPDLTQLQPAIARIRRQFDLDADCSHIREKLSRDADLAGLIEQFPGLHVPGNWDLFELSVRAVLGQQISVAAAATFAKRIVARFGIPLAASPLEEITHAFPTPAILAKADLTSVGLTNRRAETLNNLARIFESGDLNLEKAESLEAVEERLCALKGIGPWTAHYIALRALKEPDAFPESDLGLLRALEKSGIRPTPDQLRNRAEAWRPWRAYAAQLLWTADPGAPKKQPKNKS